MKTRIFSFYTGHWVVLGLALMAGLVNAQAVNPPASFAIIGHIEKIHADFAR